MLLGACARGLGFYPQDRGCRQAVTKIKPQDNTSLKLEVNHKVKEPTQFSGKKTIQKQESLRSWSLNTSRHTVATQGIGHSGLKIHFDSLLLLLFVECPTSLLKQTKKCNCCFICGCIRRNEPSGIQSVYIEPLARRLVSRGWFTAVNATENNKNDIMKLNSSEAVTITKRINERHSFR